MPCNRKRISDALCLQSTPGAFSSAQDWKKVIREGLEIQKVSGDHVSILAAPNLPLWAEQLKTCLQREARGYPMAEPLGAHTDRQKP